MVQPASKRLVTEAALQDPANPAGAFLSSTFAGAVDVLAPRTTSRKHKVSKMVTTFAAGHGWTCSGTVASFADDTTTAFLGNQSVRMSLTQSGINGRVSKTGMPAMDLTNRDIVVWVKWDNLGTPQTNPLQSPTVGNIEFLAGSGGFSSYFRMTTWNSSTVIKPATNGRWTPLRFTYDNYAGTVGTPAWNNITDMRLTVYTTTNLPLNFNVGAVAVVPRASDVFPNGALCFTFDDGYTDQFTEGRRILDQYGYPATMYTIAEWVDAADPAAAGHLTLDQLRKMRDRSGWEIAGHAFTDAAHTNRITSLTGDALDTEIRSLKRWLVDNGFQSDSFCYPGGIFNDEAVEVVGRYFTTARTTSNQPRYNLLPPMDPLLLTTYENSGTGLLTGLQGQIDNAKANKSLLIVTNHHIGAGGTPVADFEAAVAYAAAAGIEVLTVSEAIRRANASLVS